MLYHWAVSTKYTCNIDRTSKGFDQNKPLICRRVEENKAAVELYSELFKSFDLVQHDTFTLKPSSPTNL